MGCFSCFMIPRGRAMTIYNPAWYVGQGFLFYSLSGFSLIPDEVWEWLAINNKRRCSSSSNSTAATAVAGVVRIVGAVLIVEDSAWRSDCPVPLLMLASYIGEVLYWCCLDACSWLMDAGIANILNHVGIIRCSLLEFETWNEYLEHIWGCVPLMLMTLDPCNYGPWVTLIAMYLRRVTQILCPALLFLSSSHHFIDLQPKTF